MASAPEGLKRRKLAKEGWKWRRTTETDRTLSPAICLSASFLTYFFSLSFFPIHSFNHNFYVSCIILLEYGTRRPETTTLVAIDIRNIDLEPSFPERTCFSLLPEYSVVWKMDNYCKLCLDRTRVIIRIFFRQFLLFYCSSMFLAFR